MENLTAEQLLRLAETVKRQRDYLGKLRDRMRSLRFRHDDRLQAAVTEAYSAVSNLIVVASSEAHRRARKPDTIAPTAVRQAIAPTAEDAEGR